MRIFLLILLSVVLPCLTRADYTRLKRRKTMMGPPGPPRPPPPPHQQFMKKWPQPPPQFMQKHHNNMPPPRRPMRIQKKPFNNFQEMGPKIQGFQKIPQNFKLPTNLKMPVSPVQFAQQPQKAPLPPAGPPALRPVWKNPKPIQANAIEPFKEAFFKLEKAPFKVSPTLPVPIDYDYHIQTNSIPTNSAPIQQYGEKGPIHTIPAPDLSLADKHTDLRRNKPITAQPQVSNSESPFHEYHVTEASEHIPKTYDFRDQPSSNSEGDHRYQDIQDFYNQENQKSLQQTVKFEDHERTVKFEEHDQSNAKQQENVYGHATEGLYTQAIQTSFIQQRPQYSAAHYDNNAAASYDHSSDDLDSEASEQNVVRGKIMDQQPRSSSAGFVTATYKLGDSDEIPEIKLGSTNNMDSIMQSQIVNSYFDTRVDKNENNFVEPDAKIKIEGAQQSQEEIMSSYYSSLPNEDAAEKLAKLQKAGRINSSLMKFSKYCKKSHVHLCPRR